jgi:hypothetical protein
MQNDAFAFWRKHNTVQKGKNQKNPNFLRKKG